MHHSGLFTLLALSIIFGFVGCTESDQARLTDNTKQVVQRRLEDVVDGHLGRGACGEVYRATLNDHKVAIKFIPKDRCLLGGNEIRWNNHIFYSIVSEIVAFSRLEKSEFLIRMIGVHEAEAYLAIIMEYAPYGTLKDLVTKTDRLSLKAVAHITSRLAQGLRHLHEIGLIHRDIRLENLLIADDEQIKIADFGGSVFVEDLARLNPMQWGTPLYMAPEVFYGVEKPVIDPKNDMWSMGIVFYYIVAKKFPFDIGSIGGDEKDLAEQIAMLRGHINVHKPDLSGFDDRYAIVVAGMLGTQIGRRFNVYSLLKQAWFGSMKAEENKAAFQSVLKSADKAKVTSEPVAVDIKVGEGGLTDNITEKLMSHGIKADIVQGNVVDGDRYND